MNNIKIVGLGPGNIDFITGKGIGAILNSEILIGGERQLQEIFELVSSQQIYTLKKFDEMKKFVNKNINKKITFVVSGDTGFYSLLTYLKRNFSEITFDVIPGISSFQYLFAKLEMTWEKYSLHSIHGRELDYIKALENSESGIILLTDDINNPISISKKLLENNTSNIEVIVGEKLSSDDETITRFIVSDYNKYIKEYSMNVTILRKV